MGNQPPQHGVSHSRFGAGQRPGGASGLGPDSSTKPLPIDTAAHDYKFESPFCVSVPIFSFSPEELLFAWLVGDRESSTGAPGAGKHPRA
jgi:hypothetical protein